MFLENVATLFQIIHQIALIDSGDETQFLAERLLCFICTIASEKKG